MSASLARIIAVSVALAGGIRTAAAQDAPAAPAPAANPAGDALTRARDAESRARAGDYAGAIVLFKEAYALDGRAEYACNVGVAYYKARDLPRAQFFLDACMLSGADLPRDFVTSVWRVLETVEARLRQGDYAPIELRVAPATAEVRVSAFASDEVVVGSRRIWLPVGHHQLVATAPGHAPRQFTVDVGTRQPQRLDIVLTAVPAAPSQADSRPIADPTPAQPAVPSTWRKAPLMYPQTVVPRVAPKPRVNTARNLATVFTLVTLATTTTGLLVWTSSDDDDETEYVDEGAPGKVFGGMLFAASAGFGITSLILWGRAAANDRAAKLSASPTSGGGMVSISGSF